MQNGDINQSSSALAILSTPLHALYLGEFRHKYNIGYLEILVLLKRETDRPQLERVLNEVPHDTLHWLVLTRPLENRFISLYEAFSSSKVKLSLSHYEYGVFADYGRSFLANIDCEKYYWLGDGTKIIFETSFRGSKGFSRYKRQKLFEPLLRIGFGKRLSIAEDPTIFTPFELQRGSWEKNEFEWLRSRYSLVPDKKEDSVVYFFGSYFSERSGKPLMTDKVYIKYLKYIANYYRDRDLDIRYVPHRHESDCKLMEIEAIDGCIVTRFEFPAELEFIKRRILPTHVASFFSTCLFHFKLIGVSRSVISFRADFSEFNSSYGKVADEIYSSLEVALGPDAVIWLPSAGAKY